VYSTHNFFHQISHEEHSDKDCAGSCTIIIDAENSDKQSDTKSFKFSIDNISSHILCSFDFIPNIPHQKFISNNITVIPLKLPELASPPPKISLFI